MFHRRILANPVACSRFSQGVRRPRSKKIRIERERRLRIWGLKRVLLGAQDLHTIRQIVRLWGGSVETAADLLQRVHAHSLPILCVIIKLSTVDGFRSSWRDPHVASVTTVPLTFTFDQFSCARGNPIGQIHFDCSVVACQNTIPRAATRLIKENTVLYLGKRLFRLMGDNRRQMSTIN